MDRTHLVSLTSMLLAMGAATSFAVQPAAAGDSAPTEASTADPGAQTAAGEAGAHARFSVHVDPPRKARPGTATTARVRVTPKPGWHVNLDFPSSLTLEAPATVTLATVKLKKADATRLDENGLEFTVKLTPKTAGTSAVKGTLKFAVCQEDTCAPAKAPVTIQVTAG